MNTTTITFIIIATFIFAGFALIWKKSSFLNLFIKLGLMAMTVFGIIIIIIKFQSL